MARRTTTRTLFPALTLSALFLPTACQPDYPPIAPGQVRAFDVPLDAPDAAGAPPTGTLCLFSVPKGYDPAHAWPLLVVLHGYGGCAPEFIDLWREVASQTGCILAAPQGEACTAEGVGWGWGASGELAVRRSIDELLKLVHVDASRIWLAGFSQGGVLAGTLGLRYPRVFRGVALIGTPLDERHLDPILLNAPGALAGLRVYIGRGELEPNPSAARETADRLRVLGCDVRFLEYPGIGHSLPEPMTSELRRILRFLATGD
jgi:phospholipase/carboxylesterase